MKRVVWQAVANCRTMVDAATDSVLAAWGRRMATGRSITKGYPSVSARFGDSGGLNDFDDLADQVEQHVANVAVVIIYGHKGEGGLDGAHRRPLEAIYVGAQWSGEGDFETQFLEAVNAFELKARGRGLL